MSKCTTETHSCSAYRLIILLLIAWLLNNKKGIILVAFAVGVYPIPSRTRKSSPLAPMVLAREE